MSEDDIPPPLPPEALAPLSGCFPISRLPTSKIFTWTDEQLSALDTIDDWLRAGDSFISLTGAAGTGKTTAMREIVSRYPEAVLTAMTGKAALRLAQLTGREATTLHSKLYWPPNPGEDLRFTRLREPPSELIAIDESSMMTGQILEHLYTWADKGVRFLLVGDQYQLPPVITGEELKKFGDDYSVFSQVKGPVLGTVMRNVGGVLRAATKVRETGEIYEQSDMDGENEGYEFVRSSNPLQQAVEDYLADPEDHLVITWRNAVRMSANRQIRERLGHEGPLPDAGEPVLIRKNGQGVLNGEIVTCGGFEDGPRVGSMQTLWMRARFGQRILVSYEGGRDGEMMDGGVPYVKDFRKFHSDLKRMALPEPIPISWAYVLTCHAGQGGQARRTTVFLGRGDERSQYFRKETTLPSGDKVPFSARWAYTATTRSVKYTKMIVG